MVTKTLIVTKLYRTGDSSPSQWEAETSDGRYLYVRYRWGCLTIGVGQSVDDALEDSNNFFEKTLGSRYDGSLELEDLRQATEGLIEWPRAYVRRPQEFREIDP